MNEHRDLLDAAAQLYHAARVITGQAEVGGSVNRLEAWHELKRAIEDIEPILATESALEPEPPDAPQFDETTENTRKGM